MKNRTVLRFWGEYEKVEKNRFQYLREVHPILNKLDAFLHPLLENIVGHATSTLDFPQIMDDRKILLVRLDRQLEDMTTLVGSVIIAQILNAALAREKLIPTKRKQFNLYVDEFQRFATKDLAVLLTEARKYGIATTIAHQARYQEGMNQENRVASLTASNLMVFRVSDADAKELFGNFDTRPIAQPPEEATKRAIQTPVREPIQYMSHKGVHLHPAVRQFMETYGKALVLGAEKEEELERDNRHEWDRYIHDRAIYRRTVMPTTFVSSDCRTALDTLNSLFYEAMMAGKEGKDTNTIPIPVGLADNLIRASSLREGQLYLESLKTYYYSISRLGVQVTDLSARENELQAKFASLSHYVQDKVTSLQSELNAAVIRLRPLTKSCLIEEAAQARARILIVWNGQYRKFANVQVEHDYHPEKGTLPTFGVINQPLYAAGIIKQKDTWGKTTWTNKNGTGSHRPGTGSRNTQPFNTWEEAVHYYLNYYRTCWFRMNDAIMLNRNNWTQTTRQVEWEENHEKYISPKTNSYHDVYDLFLETWEPKEGIEQTWYTEAMLEAEIDRRVSAEHLDYTTTLASYIHFTPIYKQMSWEKYHTKLIEQNFANAVPVATAEMAVQKKKIEDELDQLKEIAAAKLAYDAFVQQLTTELRDVMRILAVHPVEEDSGQQEVIYRNVQQSSTDRNAQITNQFSNQPTMQAVIRIPSLGYIVCQNCGSHEQTDSTHCTACGKAIDPIVVLNVQRSTQGISMNERNQRITTIKQYNLAQKYLRKRADVEAEIVARQQMPQPPPQQPQAPKQKPATPAASPPAPPVQQQPPVAAPVAAPQPVPTPRKRVVPSPVAGQEKQCKQCGTQNNQTANFCQNCGAKL